MGIDLDYLNDLFRFSNFNQFDGGRFTLYDLINNPDKIDAIIRSHMISQLPPAMQNLFARPDLQMPPVTIPLPLEFQPVCDIYAQTIPSISLPTSMPQEATPVYSASPIELPPIQMPQSPTFAISAAPPPNPVAEPPSALLQPAPTHSIVDTPIHWNSPAIAVPELPHISPTLAPTPSWLLNPPIQACWTFVKSLFSPLPNEIAQLAEQRLSETHPAPSAPSLWSGISTPPSLIVDPEAGVRPLGLSPQGDGDILGACLSALQKAAQPFPNEFGLLAQQAFIEVEDLGAKAAIERINSRFGIQVPSTYVSPPIHEIPLIGFPTQSTVHFHCGISNTRSTIIEGGFELHDSLGERFAVQPHLIHPSNIAKGLAYVGLEKHASLVQEIPNGVLPSHAYLSQMLLQDSHIQRSIDYEVAHLSAVAQKIIATGNPNLKQLHVTFSNGGFVFREALLRLSPAFRDTIIVITAGTTAIIEAGLAHKAFNIIGNEDWPSQICNGGMTKIEAAKARSDVYVVKQNEIQSGLGGHYFMQPDYQARIAEYIKSQDMTVYEIY